MDRIILDKGKNLISHCLKTDHYLQSRLQLCVITRKVSTKTIIIWKKKHTSWYCFVQVMVNLIFWYHLVYLAIHPLKYLAHNYNYCNIIITTVKNLILKYKGSRSETIHIPSWIGESDPRSVYIYAICHLGGPYSEKLWLRSWKCCLRPMASGNIFKPKVTVFHYTDWLQAGK